jgi:hypothetical protein
MIRSTLTALLLICSTFVFGQTTFESPYVFEERSFSLEIPSKYFRIGESGGRYEPSVYSSDKDQAAETIHR